jgi:SnoaL-like domain
VATTESQPLADRVRQALEGHDLDALGALLSDDVRWGDDDHPRRCRGPAEVVATFSRLLSQGVDAAITEMTTGSSGILCHLSVTFPEGVRGPGDHDLFQVYVVEGDRITEIRRYNDRRSALAAAGLSA